MTLRGTKLMPSGRYRAFTVINGEKIHIGVFPTEQEAHDAYTKVNTERRIKPISTKKRKINASLIGTPWYGL